MRHLRRVALRAEAMRGAKGVELSMVLSEVEPVGGFVGAALSEPLLQSGILLAVFGYMVYLEPWLAALSFLVFAPQLVFVPLMQAAINRRVERRVLTMREVSDGIVREASPDGFHDRRIERVFSLHMGMYKLKFTMNFLMNLSHHSGVAAALNDPWGDVVNWFRDMTVNRVKYRLLATALRVEAVRLAVEAA